ncbi:MAG: DUF5666 domain-containing protein [Gammaproteobacteria bacterium]|nr:DUF5666 domain-containing protein [Gammaproteobacteria bacterium]MDH5803379.1 DUF5666 domain-containing protein [Gammaproteobacteria bacterium]
MILHQVSNRLNRFPPLWIALVVGTLLSCSGGETGTGLRSKVFAVGAITGFGSVHLNGVRYETADTTVSVDGGAGAESELAVGMVVTVSGSKHNFTNGSATHVAYESEIKGKVQSNNGTQLQVMGQTVVYGTHTQFYNPTGVSDWVDPAQIAADALIEVSGYRTVGETIQATYIKVESAQWTGQNMSLRGMVSSVAESGFQIADLSVVYANANVLLQQGQWVKVQSTQDITMGANTILQWPADSVDVIALSTIEAGSEFEFEGYVSSHDEINRTFVLAGQVIHYDEQTQFDSAAVGSLLNVKLEAEGYVRNDGSLYAEEVERRVRPSVELNAIVQSVDSASNSFSLLGQTLNVSFLTVFKDDSEASVRRFNLGNLQQGNRVTLKAYIDANGQLGVLELKRLEVVAADNNVWLKGELLSFDAGTGKGIVAGVVVVDDDADPDAGFAGNVGRTITIESAVYDSITNELTATKFSI